MKLLFGRKLGHAVKATIAVSILGLPLMGCGPEEKASSPEEIKSEVEKEKEISYRERDEG